MFGREQPDVVTDEDVGNYIRELQRQGEKEVNQFIMEDPEEDPEENPDEEEADGMDSDSGTTSNGAQD